MDAHKIVHVMRPVIWFIRKGVDWDALNHHGRPRLTAILAVSESFYNVQPQDINRPVLTATTPQWTHATDYQ